MINPRRSIIVFISGPYRAPTVKGVNLNIEHARQVAIKLWQEGFTVICPHLNTAHFDGLCEDYVWLESDIEIMKRCNAVYFLNTCQESVGAKAEREIALQMGLECIYE